MSNSPPDAAKTTSPALEKFLERAAPILARERGITVKSRVLLSALAKELALGEEELQTGLARLQAGAGDAPVDPALTARRREYEQYVRGQLKKLPRGILTASLQLRIVEAGHYAHELSIEDSQTIVRDAVTQSGVRVVSREEAERHVAELVAQQLRDAEWVDDVTLQRLHSVGIEWGLTNDAIDGLVEARLEQTRAAREAEQRWRYVWIGLGGLVPLALVVVIAWAMTRGGDSTSPAPGGPEGSALSLPPAPLPPPAAGDAWWDKELTAAIVYLRVNVPARAATLEKLKALHPAERSSAYQALAQPSGEEFQSPPRLVGLVKVVAGCLALDPDAAASSTLRDALLAQLPATADDGKPGVAAVYERAAWAAEALLAAIAWEGIARERRQGLVQSLAAALGGSLDESQSRAQFDRQALGLLYERLFRRMQAAAAADPAQARQAYDALMHVGAGYFDDATRERLDAEFLAAVLPQVGDRWGEFLDLLRRVTQSKESLQVLKLVELYEATDRPDLQSALELFFRSRYDLEDVPDEPAKVAAAVRKKLGVRAPAAASDRVPEFLRIAETSLARAGGGGTPAQWLRQAAELARANVMGCALVQRELGYGVFDEWRERELPVLAAPVAAAPAAEESPATSAAVAESQLRTLRAEAARLARYQAIDRVTRLSLFRKVVLLAERVPELEPDVAAMVATYLLGAKPPEEHADVMRSAGALLRKPAVVLGLADGLKASPMYQEQIAELLSAVLEREVVLPSDNTWRESYRLELLRQVQAELARAHAGAVRSSGGEAAPFADAAEYLRDAYAAQAKAQGVPAAQYQAAPSAAALLRLFVEAASSQLAGEKLRTEDADFVRRIPHELAVVDYYADHPLRQTVLLQRLWARLVGIAAGRNQPERLADVDRLLAELARGDAAATNVVAQLKAGEATILNLWMIAVKGLK